jgi:hypothetical protein
MKKNKSKSVIPEEHSPIVYNIILDELGKRKLKRLEKILGLEISIIYLIMKGKVN